MADLPEPFTPYLIILGSNSTGRFFGSAFAEAEAELAIRVAGQMDLHAIRVVGEELVALAADLPRGKLFEKSGNAFVPLAARAKVEKLMALGEAAGTLSKPDKPEPATTPADGGDEGAGGATNAGGDGDELAHTSIAHDWDSLTVGALCLIRESGEQEGFYYAVVTAMTTADSPWDVDYSLKYTELVPYDLQTRRRDEIALLPPARPAQ